MREPSLARFVGQYRNDFGEKLILRVNQSLYLADPDDDRPMRVAARLSPVDDGTRFVVCDNEDYGERGGEISFELGASGRRPRCCTTVRRRCCSPRASTRPSGSRRAHRSPEPRNRDTPVRTIRPCPRVSGSSATGRPPGSRSGRASTSTSGAIRWLRSRSWCDRRSPASISGAGSPRSPASSMSGSPCLSRLAELLAADELIAAGTGPDHPRPMSQAVLGAALRTALAEEPGVLAPVAGHPSTAAALAATYRDLRQAAPEELERLRGCGDRAADVVRIAAPCP